jgi:hypothetical protein
VAFKNIECPISGPVEDPFGEFANAFRLSVDGAEILLDFCVYSEAENTARVVSRVRVSKDFLPVIVQKIGRSFKAPVEGIPTSLFVMPPIAGPN